MTARGHSARLRHGRQACNRHGELNQKYHGNPMILLAGVDSALRPPIWSKASSR
jgi:hypothetical protein